MSGPCVHCNGSGQLVPLDPSDPRPRRYKRVIGNPFPCNFCNGTGRDDWRPPTPEAPNLTVPQLARLLDYHGAGLTDAQVAAAMRGHGVEMSAEHVARALELLGELLRGEK